MKKYKYRKLKKILVAVVGVLAIVMILGFISNLISKREEKEIHPTFEVGGLDANGKYVKCDDKLFTPDAIEYNELSIKLDFQAKIKYQLYFYDVEDKLIEKTDIIENTYVDNSKYYAKRVRILLIPEWNEEVKEEDRKVTLFNKNDFINDLTICSVKSDEEFEKFTLRINTGYLYTYECLKGMTWEEFLDYSHYVKGFYSMCIYLKDDQIVTQGAQFFVAESNDVIEDKLYYFDSPDYISFYVNSVAFECPDGMTFSEFFEYHVKNNGSQLNFHVSDGKVLTTDGKFICYDGIIESGKSYNVQSSN